MLRGPLQTCNGQRKREKATVNLEQSKSMARNFGILIPVGAGICRKCRSSMVQFVEKNRCPSVTDKSCENTAISDMMPAEADINTPCQEAEDHDIEVTASSTYTLRNRGSQPVVTNESDVNVCSQDIATCSDSQGSLWWADSQDTETSENTEDNKVSENERKRKALDNFLECCGLSPVKKQMRINWTEASDRTKKDYLIKSKRILNEVVNILAPGQGSHLVEELTKNTSESSGCDMLEILAAAYKQSADWGTQRQILSLFATTHSFSELSSYIPDLTRYRYSAARKHALTSGVGQPVPVTSYCREGLSEHQIKHFIDFVMSPCIMTDSPYLETRLKLSNGEIFQVPQIILNSVRSRVVEQYQSFCKESGFADVASDRSYLRVLEAIEPSVRKSMKGLDNYAADGAKAVDDMKKIASVLGKLSKGSEWEDRMHSGLSDGKQYLKLEYKMHLALESTVADHCCQYALSSDGDDFGILCEHLHDTACEKCNGLQAIITEVQTAAEHAPYENDDQEDDIKFTLTQSVKAIEEWKKHILRSYNQDLARSDVIENLAVNEVLIERDWAMKFLPMMYRESQSKWFGKRGLNWHITVGTYRKDGDLHSHTIVHVFDNARQDAATSAAILKDCLDRLKDKNPLLTKAFIRSDNAGCFHSVEGILGISSLNQNSELKVAHVDFADPQGGKSICDRRAAHIKGSIRKYVNEGNNVTTSTDFLTAVVQSKIKNVEIVSAAQVPSENLVKKSSKVKDITTFNNFQFLEDHVTVFKQYKIGKGVKLENVNLYESFPAITVVKTASTQEGLKPFKPAESSVHEDGKNLPHSAGHSLNTASDEETDDSSFIFTCPEPNCILTFQKFGNLNKHLDAGIHKLKKEVVSLSDKSKIEYVQQIKSKKSVLLKRSVAATFCNSITLHRGWALKTKRVVKRFSAEQALFLKEIFQKGEITGHKYDPEEVSQKMRTAKINGKRRFSQQEFLTPTQISSYFSRLALEKRKSAQQFYVDEDFIAEEFEKSITAIKNLVSK